MIDYILQVPWYGLIWITITLLYIISGWIDLFITEDNIIKEEIKTEKIKDLNDFNLYIYDKIFNSNLFNKKKGERK